MAESSTKYDGLIARAVASLSHDAGGRRAVYDRARSAQIAQLRAIRPPMPEAAIEAEQAALDAAIRRAEGKFGDGRAEPREPMAATAPGAVAPRPRATRMVLIGGAGLVAASLMALLGYAYWPKAGKPVQQAAQPAERAAPERRASAPSAVAAMPFPLMRQVVYHRSTSPAGTIVIDKSQRYLYVIQANVSAIRYGIAVGGGCAEAAGRYVISGKADAAGSPQSTQAAATITDASSGRAILLDPDTRSIHGTDLSQSIGKAVRAGCFQLIQADFAELYERAPVGTRVVVN